MSKNKGALFLCDRMFFLWKLLSRDAEELKESQDVYYPSTFYFN